MGVAGGRKERPVCGYTAGTEQRQTTPNHPQQPQQSHEYFPLLRGLFWLNQADFDDRPKMD